MTQTIKKPGFFIGGSWHSGNALLSLLVIYLTTLTKPYAEAA